MDQAAEYVVCTQSSDLERQTASLEMELKERRRIEADLRESEARYRAIFENSMDAIFLSPADGAIGAANPAACTLFQMTEEELCRAGRAGIIDPDDPRVPKAVQHRIESGMVRSELGFRRKDGSTFMAEVTSVFLSDGRSSFVIVRDISDRKRAEEEILCLNASLEQRVSERTKELEQVIREQESFSYSVSHDLRAPLRHINSYCTILADDFGADLPAEGLRYLESIRQATIRMGGLIDHLLELSRVSRAELKKERVDLSELACGITQMIASNRDPETYEFGIEQGLFVQGDRILLRQLLQNLFDNAWKYSSSRPKPKIEFGRIMIGRKRYFYVRDNGVGFDMQYSNKLFKIFHRLHGGEFEGTGIGLATVQRIINRHGGTVWAEGKPDKGAIFYFTLPL